MSARGHLERTPVTSRDGRACQQWSGRRQHSPDCGRAVGGAAARAPLPGAERAREGRPRQHRGHQPQGRRGQGLRPRRQRRGSGLPEGGGGSADCPIGRGRAPGNRPRPAPLPADPRSRGRLRQPGAPAAVIGLVLRRAAVRRPLASRLGRGGPGRAARGGNAPDRAQGLRRLARERPARILGRSRHRRGHDLGRAQSLFFATGLRPA